MSEYLLKCSSNQVGRPIHLVLSSAAQGSSSTTWKSHGAHIMDYLGGIMYTSGDIMPKGARVKKKESLQMPFRLLNDEHFAQILRDLSCSWYCAGATAQAFQMTATNAPLVLEPMTSTRSPDPFFIWHWRNKKEYGQVI